MDKACLTGFENYPEAEVLPFDKDSNIYNLPMYMVRGSQSKFVRQIGSLEDLTSLKDSQAKNQVELIEVGE